MENNQNEHKYWLLYEYVDEIIHQLKRSLYPFQHQLQGQVLSIFLDSDNLELYRMHLLHPSDNTLIRLRWYGEKETDPILVEIKQTTGGIRTRAHLPIPRNSINAFLNGTYSDENFLAAVSSKDEGSNLNLNSTIRILIKQLDLRPKIFIKHFRQIFRPKNDNRFFFTLDTGIEMARTQQPFEIGNNYQDLFKFPFAILEIKFNNNLPKFIKPILDEAAVKSILNNSYVHNCPDLSKYAYGVTALFPLKELGLPRQDWANLEEFFPPSH